ncbi:MAG: chemotaxis protein CheA [Oscillospiraceae bacterium]|jgi:two-component system chemotaxis sensor kinase CheA|nr:chemotaxis protein CheA [Oscillospiraceae bacterium]
MKLNEQDSMIEIFIYENQQLLETLEDLLLQGEKDHTLNDGQINEIFRIMHTIKGSSSMMSFDSLATLSHAVEDLFSQIREKRPRSSDWDEIFDIVLTATDLIKEDITKISNGEALVDNNRSIVDKIHTYLGNLGKRKELPPDSQDAEDYSDDEYNPEVPFYKIKITFEPGCQMENMRAFGVVTALNGHFLRAGHLPSDLMLEGSGDEIAKNGFILYLQSGDNPDTLKDMINGMMYIQSVSLILMPDDSDELPENMRPKRPRESADSAAGGARQTETAKQNFISVNVNKLDKLMDLVGEIVTSESMVTKNPEVIKLQLESFEREGQQLRKLINELQEVVMSIRMLPLSTTFHKMQRIVRDMSKKVQKEVELVIIGEETEVDKNIIDNLSDPLMHLIRNAVDHGLENPEDRVKKNKPAAGRVTLEARNTGGDVFILVTDDGKGLNRSKIIKKATAQGLTTKPESEISDKEAFSFIFLPGFSTNETVTEFSGRGVGMDVVRQNIDKVGGTISVESAKDEGSTFMIKIPLTLAIMEGMKLRVGDLVFIVPMLSIQESFKPDMKNVFLDPDGNEMIMIREKVYPIVRLHRIFDIPSQYENLADGILVMMNTENSTYCLFIDELIGEQQAVIKPLPSYIQKNNNGMHGIGGCAILGDGSISLIIDINNLVID